MSGLTVPRSLLKADRATVERHVRDAALARLKKVLRESPAFRAIGYIVTDAAGHPEALALVLGANAGAGHAELIPSGGAVDSVTVFPTRRAALSAIRQFGRGRRLGTLRLTRPHLRRAIAAWKRYYRGRV